MAQAFEKSHPALTALLNRSHAGDAAAGEAFAAAFPKLRAIAGSFIARERPDHTLQPTELVNEVYLRLAPARMTWQNREHFYAVWAKGMRHVLTDHGRGRRSHRRGCGLRVAFDENRHVPPSRRRELELVEELLERLKEADPLAERVVFMKFYAGLTDKEVAEKIGCSQSTVRRHWGFARAWLARRLAE